MVLGEVGFEGEKQMKLEESLRVVEESMVAEAIDECLVGSFRMVILGGRWKRQQRDELLPRG